MKSWVIRQVFFFIFPSALDHLCFCFVTVITLFLQMKKWHIVKLLYVLLFNVFDTVTVACFISYYCVPETQRATYQIKNVCNCSEWPPQELSMVPIEPLSFACSHRVGVWWVMGIFSVLNTFSLSFWFSHLHTVANHSAREKWGKSVFKNLSAIQQNSTAEAWWRKSVTSRWFCHVSEQTSRFVTSDMQTEAFACL